MFGRIYALISRYTSISITSFPRLLSIFYWPSIQILLWGFFTNFLESSDVSFELNSVSFLLSAVILWDILFRGQLGLSMTFFEELWSRNLVHLMITPLRNYELVLSLIIVSFLRTCLGLSLAVVVASYFFGLHLFDLGFFLILFFFSLIVTGWSIGFLVSGLVLRYGQSFEELAWAFIFVLLPFSCVYYPIDSLPVLFQYVANIFPPAYVFEGMREILINKSFSNELFLKSVFLNFLYFFLSAIFFSHMISKSKKDGSLFQFGE